MDEPLSVPAVKALTIRLEETGKQVLSSVTDGMEKPDRLQPTRNSRRLLQGGEGLR